MGTNVHLRRKPTAGKLEAGKGVGNGQRNGGRRRESVAAENEQRKKVKKAGGGAIRRKSSGERMNGQTDQNDRRKNGAAGERMLIRYGLIA